MSPSEGLDVAMAWPRVFLQRTLVEDRSGQSEGAASVPYTDSLPESPLAALHYHA